ncbi:MAG: hypothetical protein D6730_12360 [Bacteroidetes bacterium]|nr:MAG: hypothetical protein D6730_12360 [Bacteroidota bacterium]
MNFSLEEIIHLYGSKFMIISEPQAAPQPTGEAETTPRAESQAAPQAEPPSPALRFSQGEAVTWRMKPQAQLALILQQTEFNDRALTTALKGYIVQAGIPTDAVGFGVIPDNCDSCDCRDMPVKVGIVFQLFGQKIPSPVEVGEKRIFAAADLGLIHTKESFQRRLRQILQQAYQLSQT